jgi:Zn-finger nucleic acid-binding protein
MTDRSGIEIDYCPQCRGVWLDRGELDKIIERSAQAVPTQAAGVWVNETPQPPQPPMPPAPFRGEQRNDSEHRDYKSNDRDYDKRREYDDDDRRYGYKRKKRKGFLDELFDFD